MIRRLAFASACAAIGVLLTATGAAAKPALQYQYAESFDGADSTAGAFVNIANLAINQETGNVLVIDVGRTYFSQFDSDGDAVPFTEPLAPGSSISVQAFNQGRPYIAVDNSGGPSQGKIYVVPFGGGGSQEVPYVRAYFPSGKEQGGNWPLCGNRCAKPYEFITNPLGVAVGEDGAVWVTTPLGGFLTPIPGEIVPFTPDGVRIDERAITVDGSPRALDLDADGNLYVQHPPPNVGDSVVRKIVPDLDDPQGWQFQEDFFSRAVSPYPAGNSAESIAVDRSRGLVYVNQATRVDVYDTDGNQVGSFGQPEGSYAGLISGSTGIAVNEATGKVYVSNATTDDVDIFESLPAVTVPEVATGGTSEVTATTATLEGSVDPAGGGDTTECRFVWGLTAQLENSTPCAEGQVHPSGGGEVGVTAEVTGLLKGRQYFYRVVAGNGIGPLQYGTGEGFWAAERPVVSDVEVTDVSTTTAEVRAMIDPEGGNTSYWVEVGETTAYGVRFPVPYPSFEEEYKDCYFRWFFHRVPPCTGRLRWASGYSTVEELVQPALADITDLKPNTTYHYRVVAENDAGQEAGPDQTFRTFAFIPSIVDPCPNKLARQQTGGAHLLDCRAYELVSAPDAAGYDVESDQAPGLEPLPGFPGAPGKALYAVVDGGIPGTGNPTNRGPDPYVATRDADNERWTTTYVGVPSDAPSLAPFASRLADADDSLRSFAFGGSDFCSPCFDDGDTNVPVRLADGSLGKGMIGSLDPGDSVPAGDIRKHFSNDGSHFVFGSTSQFEPEGNDNGTNVTIYDRNLETGVTQVVSTDPDGNVIAAGEDLAVLDISSDGSRIVVGEVISSDAAGNDHVRPYMHVGTSEESIDLAPGTTSGVVYNGMTADGSTVFFSSPDPLTGDDSDTSTDVFAARPDGAVADLSRVSQGSGGTGNTDSCDPLPNSVNAHWNSVAGGADCGAVPIGGGASIGEETGAIYFLSPEQLDGSNGVSDAPNLYYSKPGEAPRFVATLESTHSGPSPLVTSHPFSHHFGTLSNPESVAVHMASGSVYAMELGTSSIRKFDADGNPSNFTATGTDSIGGIFGFSGYTQLAVDNSGGATDGNIYVTNPLGGTVNAYDSAGNPIATLLGTSTPALSFGFPSGVAVAPNGDLYVAAGTSIHRYVPAGAAPAEGDYVSSLVLTETPVGIAADSTGAVYTHLTSFFPAPGVKKFEAGQFGLPSSSGAMFDAASKGVYVDPGTDHVFITYGDEMAERLPSGALHNTFGSGDVVNALGLASNSANGRVYSTDATEGRISVFGTKLGADRRIDNPAVVNAVNAAETHHANDFDVDDDGSVAVFPSTISLTGSLTKQTTQLYRFADEAGSLVCISCAATEKPSVGDSSLASTGASVTDDGRVFFNSPDRLVLSDGNGQGDVYEWSEEVGTEGGVQLISTGVSDAESSLLSVTADGTDAFFFTRQKLAPQDLNGPTVKLYTAREDGGFFKLPPPQGCKASDECRGGGTKQAAPPNIGSVTGSDGQVRTQKPPRKCRKGKVRRRGKCVTKPKNKKSSKSKKGAKRNSGNRKRVGR